ncbi:helix-turn-helix domain-containing protein [Chloroflexota bacterium]
MENNEEKISDMLTTGQVARLLDVHTSTVRRWSEQGVIKAYRIDPRASRKFLRRDVALLFLERALRNSQKTGDG